MKPTTGHKVLLRIGSLYVLALLAPVLLTLLLLGQAEKSLLAAEEARTRQSLEAKAQQTALVIDEAVERAQAAAYSLWRSDSVSPLLRGGRGDRYRVVNQLNDLVLVNSRLIEDIAICFHDRSLTLTAAGPGEDEDVYARFIAGGMTPNAWQEAARGFTGGQLICRVDDKLTFLQTYPVIPIGDRSRATLLVLLRESLPEDTLLVDERTGRLMYGMEHEGWLTAKETSGRLPLVYVVQADGALLVEYAAAMRERMARACALCLFGAAALAFLLAWRQLNPLRRLAALARGESAALPLDPYAEIQTALLEAQQQRLLLEGLREEDERTKRLRPLIEALADPALTPERVLSYMDAAGLSTAGVPICLARLSCADADARLLGADAGQEPLALAGEIVRGLLGRRWNTWAVSARDAYWFFLLPDEKQLEGFSGRSVQRCREPGGCFAKLTVWTRRPSSPRLLWARRG